MKINQHFTKNYNEKLLTIKSIKRNKYKYIINTYDCNINNVISA